MFNYQNLYPMKKIDLLKIPTIKIVYQNPVKYSERIRIINSCQAYEILKEYWDNGTIEHVEEFKILMLNRANKVLGIVNLSKGGINGTVVDMKVLLQHVLKANASAFIIAHNHPSGNNKPSSEDTKITKKIKEACKYHDINLIDHVILTSEGYYSFADEGLL